MSNQEKDDILPTDIQQLQNQSSSLTQNNQQSQQRALNQNQFQALRNALINHNESQQENKIEFDSYQEQSESHGSLGGNLPSNNSMLKRTRVSLINIDPSNRNSIGNQILNFQSRQDNILQVQQQENFNLLDIQHSESDPVDQNSPYTTRCYENEPKEDEKKQEQEQQQPQVTTNSQSPNLNNTEGSQRQKQKKIYNQSIHKNVYKNFGTALQRFIDFNPQCKLIQQEQFLYDNKKIEEFKTWFRKDIKITRKQDFIKSWQWLKNDNEVIRNYKEILRIISKEFFENYSEIYLLNSRKLCHYDIHQKSIHLFLKGINDPQTLEKFKPNGLIKKQ